MATVRRRHDDDDNDDRMATGGRDFNHTKSRSRSRSRSPERRTRPAAADFWSRSKSPVDDRERKHRHHRHHRRHQDRSRDGARRASPSADDRREHKRRKHDHDHHDHHDHNHHHHHKRTHRQTDASSAPKEASRPAELPYQARDLSHKHDLPSFTPLFAYYLDIQKGRDFYDMDAHEQKGRWKSFVNKWNRGELAEGWYDPEMFEKVVREAPERQDADRGLQERSTREESRASGGEPTALPARQEQDRDDGRGEDEDDSDYGPPPPPGQSSAHPSSSRHGPGIPTLSDLALQREDATSARESQFADLRLARKADRALQKQQLDELVPRAEPGTRERKLEKKALVNEKMRGFREARGGGDGLEEVGDADLLGGGNDDVAEYKKMLAGQQRKKTERELRREAEARARLEEREERLREWREREEEKMKGLKELAKARFG